MARRDDEVTPVSLLERLRDPQVSPDDWEAFVERYGRLLYRWCRRWGLQESDAQDVAQNTLMALVRQIGTFEYDARGSFRAWLKTVAYRCWTRAVDERARAVAARGGSSALEALTSTVAREDLADRFEAEGRQELLERAMERVRRRVATTTLEAFRLTAFEGLSGEETAGRLGLQPGAVYMARLRVQKLLLEEMRRLDPKT
jgi:RNA polymerase sigma-70 factor (ECF subfamily)